MSITRFALRRPVTVLMVFLAVAIIGLISWQRLSLELLPRITYPQITVLTAHEGVAPTEIESLVTRPIEEAVGTVQGVQGISSVSREGLSLVTLDFEWGTDTNLAALDVREKIEAIRETLPRTVGNPVIIKMDPGSLPIMTLGVTGEASLEALNKLASETIKQRLERAPGVALARISGAAERQILVAVDQGRLFAHGIPISEIGDRLREANLNFPGGSIEKGRESIRIRTLGQFESLKDLEQVVVAKGPGNIPVFLTDVASVQDGFKDPTSSFTINGRESVGVSVFKQAESNTVEVADAVEKALERLRLELDQNIHITVVHNQAAFIKDALSDLQTAGVVGGLLSFSVLLLFLGSLRSAAIITTAIPISVLGAFTLMYLAGASLNIMSLGGLALGVGLLVDNGIVILENIHRHRKLSKNAYDAALRGSQEMQAPVVASTFAHIIVFLPILFVEGLAGKFFAQLAITISFSLFISVFVALSLNPMLEAGALFDQTGGAKPSNAGRGLIRRVARRGVEAFDSVLSPLWKAVDGAMMTLKDIYLKVLLAALSYRARTLFLTFLIVGFSFVLVPGLGHEFLPEVDQGSFLLQVKAEPGSTLESTKALALRIGEALREKGDVRDVLVNIGYDRRERVEKALGGMESHIARITVVLKEDREKTLKQVVDSISPRLAGMGAAEIEFVLSQDVVHLLRQKQRAPEILEIRGPEIGVIRDLTRELIGRLVSVEGLKDVYSSLGDEEPEIRIAVNREKAALFKLSVKEIADTVRTAMEGSVATTFRQREEDVDILVRLREEDRRGLAGVENALIRTPMGGSIRLKEVAEIEEGTRLNRIEHRNLARVSVIHGNISGVPYNRCLEAVQSVVAGMSVPPDYTVTLSGEHEEMGRSFRNLAFALFLSILLVYMLLASLFESFLYPFIIMFSVPLAAVGVVLILLATGTPISLGVFIGGIMLGGIVVNNSIILVDYINRLKRGGIKAGEAIVEAGKVRLRPIVMTAATTVLALLPLAAGIGRGAEIRSPLALTVIGGLLTSTFMTLVVVPVIYSLVEDLKGWGSSMGKGKSAELSRAEALHPLGRDR